MESTQESDDDSLLKFHYERAPADSLGERLPQAVARFERGYALWTDTDGGCVEQEISDLLNKQTWQKYGQLDWRNLGGAPGFAIAGADLDSRPALLIVQSIHRNDTITKGQADIIHFNTNSGITKPSELFTLIGTEAFYVGHRVNQTQFAHYLFGRADLDFRYGWMTEAGEARAVQRDVSFFPSIQWQYDSLGRCA
ncbi:PHO85 cyclin-1 [Verticillium dahliae VDG2]|nr:PHO85 cyclin-1 [Verticillium dahliae VDG2]